MNWSAASLSKTSKARNFPDRGQTVYDHGSAVCSISHILAAAPRVKRLQPLDPPEQPTTLLWPFDSQLTSKQLHMWTDQLL